MTLVERLRRSRHDTAGETWLCLEAAVRIEALEAKINKWEITDEWADQQKRIEALKAALRGVRDRYVIQDNAEKCAAEMDDIARAALGEGKLSWRCQEGVCDHDEHPLLPHGKKQHQPEGKPSTDSDQQQD